MEDSLLETLTFCLESDLTNCSDQTTCNLNIAKLTESVFAQKFQTPCPFAGCAHSFSSVNITDDRGGILKHLLVSHNFVIDDVSHIANLRSYLLHWRERFASAPIEEFCSAFWMDSTMTPEESLQELNANNLNTPAELESTTQTQPENSGRVKYFMLGDILAEDKALRTKIWNERLETVLEVNQLEREQTDLQIQCLFCKNILTGNRTHLFAHMAQEHSFHIGQPDNIVFVNELMVFLVDTLNKLKCIYCGKTFKDKVMMREHMRKKLHKKINPANPDYDRFYIINYLEPGKDWKTLNEEEPEDERTEEEWLEKEELTSVVCLLCPFQSEDFDSVLSHMKSNHSFDFEAVVQPYDFYEKVKIVNFIRRNIHQSVCFYCNLKFLEKGSLVSHLLHHEERKSEFPQADSWNRPEHFFPTYENDQFLILLDRNNSEDGTNSNSDDSKVIPEDISCSQFSDVVE